MGGLPVLGSLIRASNACLRSRNVVICAIFEIVSCCEFDIVPLPQLWRGWSGGIDGFDAVETTYLKYLERNEKIVNGAVSGCYAAVEGISQGTAFEVQAWDGKRHLLDPEPPAPVRTGGGTR